MGSHQVTEHSKINCRLCWQQHLLLTKVPGAITLAPPSASLAIAFWVGVPWFFSEPICDIVRYESCSMKDSTMAGLMSGLMSGFVIMTEIDSSLLPSCDIRAGVASGLLQCFNVCNALHSKTQLDCCALDCTASTITVHMSIPPQAYTRGGPLWYLAWQIARNWPVVLSLVSRRALLLCEGTDLRASWNFFRTDQRIYTKISAGKVFATPQSGNTAYKSACQEFQHSLQLLLNAEVLHCLHWKIRS